MIDRDKFFAAVRDDPFMELAKFRAVVLRQELLDASKRIGEA